MPKGFRELLDKAKGESQHIIVVVLDIRGFTPFCEREDSANVASYIKKVYMKIIDDYFPDASFYKPTGDGLLVTVPYDEESLNAKVKETIENCLRLSRDFQGLLEENEMINFETPGKIGIGVARGNACCITSEEGIMDYSGRILNLASRLMDIARPSGIVLDSRFGLKLLSKETRNLFVEDKVYLRGVAEKEPITIYYTKHQTLIPPLYKKPLKEPQLETCTEKVLFKDLKQFPVGFYVIDLPHNPLDEIQVHVEIYFEYDSKATGRRFFSRLDKKVDGKAIRLVSAGKRHTIEFWLESILETLRKSKDIKDDTEIAFNISYPIS